MADWLPAERPTDAASRQLPQQSWFDDSDDFGYPGFSGHCETALASQSRWGAGGTGSHGFPGLVRSTTPVPQVWGASFDAGLPLPTIAECRESVAGAWLQRDGDWIRLVATGVGCEWGMLMETGSSLNVEGLWLMAYEGLSQHCTVSTTCHVDLWCLDLLDPCCPLTCLVPLRIRLGQVGAAVQACKRVLGVAACVRDEWEGRGDAVPAQLLATSY